MYKILLFFLLLCLYHPSFSQDENTDFTKYDWQGDRYSAEVIDWVNQQNEKSFEYFDSIKLLDHLEQWKVQFDKEYKWNYLDKFLPEAEQVGPFAQRISNNNWTRIPFDNYLKGKKPKFLVRIEELEIKPEEKWNYDRVISNPNNYDKCLVLYKKQGHKVLKGIVEYDANDREVVKEGFQLPPAKTTAYWRDEQSIYISTNLENPYDPGYNVRVWRRGKPIESAEVIFESTSSKVIVELISLRGELLIKEQRQTYDESWYHLKEDKIIDLFLPKDVKDLAVVSGQLVIHLRSGWKTKHFDFAASSLVAIDFDSFLAGSREFRLVQAPNKEKVLDKIWSTDDVLILRELDNVKSSITEWTFSDNTWKSKSLIKPIDWNITITTTQNESNRYYIRQLDFYGYRYFLRNKNGEIIEYANYYNNKINPEDYVVKQEFATSKDGTQVPYLIIHKKGLKMDGENPVLMTGYGGWGRSILPSPLNTRWRWVNDGGVFVIANIRGGGEYGSKWHYAARKSKRQNAYNDFFAVAQKLINSGLTQERRIGIWGGSNGGLLVANSFLQHPSTFGAVLIRSGSLKLDDVDVKEGGTMIGVNGERGDPEIAEDWDYMKKISPFHVLHSNKPYPPVLLLSSRNDDVSHPSRSRKFYSRMTDLGYKDVYLIETDGGSHGFTDLPNESLLDLVFFYKNIHPDYNEILKNEIEKE